MNSDLSKCKVGDYICTRAVGWEQIISVDENDDKKPFETNSYWYSKDGKSDIGDKYPSAYIEPPVEWNAEPRPRPLKKGDKVIADGKYRRYFSHMEGEKFACFRLGTDEWSVETSSTKFTSFDNCVKWEPEDEWIKHDGGECPVDSGTVISELKFRSGENCETLCLAGDRRWLHIDRFDDIMEYKIKK